MRLDRVFITGYRGFNDFEIKSSNLTNLTIIAGQNGTGKSTILEVVTFLLNSHDRNQIIDPNIVQGITEEEMIWEVTVSLSEGEIDYLVLSITEKNPYWVKNKAQISRTIKEDLLRENGEYGFSLRVVVKRSDLKNDWFNTVTPEFIRGDGNKGDIPKWLQFIQENQIYLVDFIKPFEGIGDTVSTAFASGGFDPELGKFTNTNVDLRNRGTRTTINVGMLLNKLAINDIWQVFKEREGEFKGLLEKLNVVNEIIQPLQLNFDPLLAENGYLRFKMENTKTGKSYPLQFSSSGENK